MRKFVNTLHRNLAALETGLFLFVVSVLPLIGFSTLFATTPDTCLYVSDMHMMGDILGVLSLVFFGVDVWAVVQDWEK